jgi:hypothetical protein
MVMPLLSPDTAKLSGFKSNPNEYSTAYVSGSATYQYSNKCGRNGFFHILFQNVKNTGRQQTTARG